MLNAVRSFAAVVALVLCTAVPAQEAQDEGVRVTTLDNGMTMLIMRRPTLPGQIACGWMLRGGASLDPPETPGLSHMVLSILYESTNASDGKPPAAASPFRPLNPVQQRVVMLHDLAFWETQYPRWRGGEIGDPFAPANQTPELSGIREMINAAFDPNRSAAADPTNPLIAKQVAPILYHVGSAPDFSLAFTQIPSASLEDWAQHEVTRLSEFPSEERFNASQSDLLARRLELGPRSPVLTAQHDLDAALWPNHPYGRRAMSSIGTVDDATYDVASTFFNEHVRPENVVIFVVGDVNPVGAAVMLRERFEQLPASESASAQLLQHESATPPPPTAADLTREWSLQTRARLLYRTVAIDHPDHAALLVAAKVLRNRLHRRYIDTADPNAPKNVAWIAAGADGRARGGQFVIEAESAAHPDADGLPGAAMLSAEELRSLISEELERLRTELIDDAELEATRSLIAADLLTPMNDQVSLLLTLATYEGMGDWGRFNTLYGEVNAVSAIDVQAAARRYLAGGRTAVGRFNARPYSLKADPELRQLSEDYRQGAVTLLNRMLDTTTPDTWAETATSLEQQLDTADPLQQVLVRFLVRRLRERVEAEK